jgi:hypothetical protein
MSGSQESMQKASQTNLTQKRQIKGECFCKKHTVSCLQISPYNRDLFLEISIPDISTGIELRNNLNHP